MTAMRWVGYAGPLVAGLLVPALLAGLPAAPRPRRILLAAGAAALLAFAGLAGLPAAALTAAAGLLAAGLFLALGAAGTPAPASQAAASLALPALLGSLFALGPGIPDSALGPQAGPLISARISWLLAANPYAALAYSAFDTDLLTTRFFYSNHLAGYPYATPRWTQTSALLAVPGLLLAAASRLRPRSQRP